MKYMFTLNRLYKHPLMLNFAVTSLCLFNAGDIVTAQIFDAVNIPSFSTKKCWSYLLFSVMFNIKSVHLLFCLI